MKIKRDDFRVREGETVDLAKWKTLTKPVYRSKRHYAELLATHVEELSALQERAGDVGAMLYHASGLLGMSGLSGDMRVLLSSQDPHAAAAIDLFVYRISRELGSLAAALGGVDALVFTAGIGEHATQIRQRICDAAAWLGVESDLAANRAGGPCLTRAWVVPTDEDLMIARHTWRLLATDRAQADGHLTRES